MDAEINPALAGQVSAQYIILGTNPKSIF